MLPFWNPYNPYYMTQINPYIPIVYQQTFEGQTFDGQKQIENIFPLNLMENTILRSIPKNTDKNTEFASKNLI